MARRMCLHEEDPVIPFDVFAVVQAEQWPSFAIFNRSPPSHNRSKTQAMTMPPHAMPGASTVRGVSIPAAPRRGEGRAMNAGAFRTFTT